jgi:hypothetical protein
MAGITYTSGKVTISIRDILKNVLDLTSLTDELNKSWVKEYVTGTLANQAQIHWHDTVTLSSAAVLLLDLQTTALAADAVHCNNGFGDCNFTKVRELLIVLTTVTSGFYLKVGGGSNPVPLFSDASDIAKVKAGGHLLLGDPVDGTTVTAATGDLLKIENASAGSVTFDIFLLGTGTVV